MTNELNCLPRVGCRTADHFLVELTFSKKKSKNFFAGPWRKGLLGLAEASSLLIFREILQHLLRKAGYIIDAGTDPTFY